MFLEVSEPKMALGPLSQHCRGLSVAEGTRGRPDKVRDADDKMRKDPTK